MNNFKKFILNGALALGMGSLSGCSLLPALPGAKYNEMLITTNCPDSKNAEFGTIELIIDEQAGWFAVGEEGIPENIELNIGDCTYKIKMDHERSGKNYCNTTSRGQISAPLGSQRISSRYLWHGKSGYIHIDKKDLGIKFIRPYCELHIENCLPFNIKCAKVK